MATPLLSSPHIAWAGFPWHIIHQTCATRYPSLQGMLSVQFNLPSKQRKREEIGNRCRLGHYTVFATSFSVILHTILK